MNVRNNLFPTIYLILFVQCAKSEDVDPISQYVTTYQYATSSCANNDNTNYVVATTIALGTCYQSESNSNTFIKYVSIRDLTSKIPLYYYIKYFDVSAGGAAGCSGIPHTTSAQYNFNTCTGSGNLYTVVKASALFPNYISGGFLIAGYNTNNCNVFPTYSQWTASLKFVSLGSKSFIATCSDSKISYTTYNTPYCNGTYSLSTYGPYKCTNNPSGALIPSEPNTMTLYVSTYCNSTVTIAPTATPTTATLAPSTTRTEKQCFAGSESVVMESGETRLISQVRVGDRVLAVTSRGDAEISEVIAVPHKPNIDKSIFIHLRTQSGNSIKLSKHHIIAAGSCTTSEMSLVVAQSVQIGSCLHSSPYGRDKVISINRVVDYGLYTIVTKSEFLLVNGIVASPFAHNHALTHAVYNIYRAVYLLCPPLLQNAVTSVLQPALESLEELML